ncbi:MAG TPA: SPOR domain-containing protein [Saprospiraceae bacterium]|nr:SPOR domain-containing protein [Saprospiraceae bacterium]
MKKLLLPISLLFASGFLSFGHSQVPQTEASKSDTDLVKVYVKQDPSTYKKVSQESPVELEFAVQLSASSRPITDKSSLSSWEQLGPVYIHTENGMYKVRIGPYDNQDQAKNVLLKAKERGKKDAFIVIQKGLENYAPQGVAIQPDFEPEVINRAPAPVTPSPDVKVTVPSEPVVSSEETGDFKVRLASYLKPGGFNTNDVDQYGPLESYRKGEWTIMMIGGFKTQKEATKVRDLVIAKGYTDAAVVVDRGGIIEETD